MGSSKEETVNEAKRKAAQTAVEEHFPEKPRYVGIGSGSTVVYVVEAISKLPSHRTENCTFIPTGFQSRQLITDAGLKLGSIDSLMPPHVVEEHGGHGIGGSGRRASHHREVEVTGGGTLLDVAFDGADEIDEDLNCIKGGGGCLFQEKLVATSALKFVCVADYRKMSPRLLTNWKTIPIEVVPLSTPAIMMILKRLGSMNPELRMGGASKAGPMITDNCNFIIDAPFKPLLTGKQVQNGEGEGQGKNGIWEVSALAKKLKEQIGIVEVGLFWGRNGYQTQSDTIGGAQKPVAAYFGMEDGTVQSRKTETAPGGN